MTVLESSRSLVVRLERLGAPVIPFQSIRPMSTDSTAATIIKTASSGMDARGHNLGTQTATPIKK